MNQADDQFLASQIAKFRQQHPELFPKTETENSGQEKRASQLVESPGSGEGVTQGEKLKR